MEIRLAVDLTSGSHLGSKKNIRHLKYGATCFDMKINWNLSQHATFARKSKRALNNLKRDYLFPHSEIWPPETASFPDLANIILEGLEENNRQQFVTCCAASWLLDPQRPARVQAWLKSLDSRILDSTAIPLPLSEANQWSWIFSHVLVVKENTGRVIRSLIGIGNTREGIHFPKNEVINSDARESIRLAWELAETGFKGASFWPMLSFENNSNLILGKSMGLPAYLSFKSFDSDKSINSIVATGAINRQKKVLPVEGLLQKLKIARDEKFSVFLYPEPVNGHELSTDDNKTIEPISVGTLEEAEICFRFYTPNSNNTISRFLRSNNTTEILSLFFNFPNDLLIYIENKYSKIKNCFHSKKLTISDIKYFDDNIQNLMFTYPLNRQSISFILDIFDDEIARICASMDTKTFRKICNKKILWLNYTIKIQDVIKWKLLRDTYLYISEEPENDIDYDNYQFKFYSQLILANHQTFHFEAEISNHFIRLFEEHRNNIENLGSLFNKKPVYGKKCFDLCEKYGVETTGYEFSKIEHEHTSCYKSDYEQLKNFENERALLIKQNIKNACPYYIHIINHLSFSKKCNIEFIRKIFNNFFFYTTFYPEAYNEHINELYIHLAYASLEINDYELAHIIISRGLNIDLFSNFNEFENINRADIHALLSRYVLDSSILNNNFLNWIERKENTSNTSHPWQIWHYNCGQILKRLNPDLAIHNFFESLKICKLNIDKQHVRTMALLPLSALYEILPSSENHILKKETLDTINFIRDSFLNKDHFVEILSSENWKDSLSIIQKKSHDIFPFIYR